jgi:hypothetical protein
MSNAQKSPSDMERSSPDEQDSSKLLDGENQKSRGYANRNGQLFPIVGSEIQVRAFNDSQVSAHNPFSMIMKKLWYLSRFIPSYL